MTSTVRRLVPCSLLALLAACAGQARPVPAAPGPTVAEPLRFFVGAWEGKNRSASGRLSTLRWQVAPTMGGRWLAGEARVAEVGIEARDFLGIQVGQIVRVYVDSQGSRATLSSPGWSGNVMTWEGEVHAADGTTARVREIVTRVDQRTLHARWERWSTDAWALMSEETLYRR